MNSSHQEYTISLPKDPAEEARSRSGAPGLSAYAEEALSEHVARERLDELVAAMEAKHGPVTEEELQQVREQLRQARLEQGVVTDSASHGPETA